jgi:cephalosporin-C deacetylase-like acetyl esterase
MSNLKLKTVSLFCLIIWANSVTSAQTIPDDDRRLTEIRHLDLTYNFAGYRTREEWLARAESLRKQILFSAGLWPMPAKQPIRASIFGKVDRGDHTIEKVYFESHPGFYVTGNLYRPKTATGKLPAVLCPHGHWTYGRFENQDLNSGPARAANFARQGYLAFSYDMVGYGDSTAISHRFATGHREGIVDREALWGVNLLGLQLWNSIRSIDFLLSLPEIDPERIACTGESGGGTQTFLLMAVDDRIKVAAPVNMISFLMQGGSLCENAPNLRIDTNNVELGAIMAPRPLMLVSTTGDWTKNTMTSEYPAVRGIYRLFGAEEKVTAVQMNAPHNYNRDSREAVYGWFAYWILGRKETDPIKEKGGGVASLSDLMVFFGRPRPDNEVKEAGLVTSLIERARQQYQEYFPNDAASLEKFRRTFGASLNYSLMAEFPDANTIVATNPQVSSINELASGATKEEFVISRSGRGDRIPMTLWKQRASRSVNSLVLLVSSEGSPTLTQSLVKNGHNVATIKYFPGIKEIPGNIKFFTTYNRTTEANRIQDILTALAYLHKHYGGMRLSIIAQGQAGLWALLARGLAPKIDKVVIDAAQFDTANDEEFTKFLPIPGIRRAGDFTTAVTIAPLASLFIHNTGNKFQTERLAEVYRKFGRAEDFIAQPNVIDNSALLNWLSSK